MTKPPRHPEPRADLRSSYHLPLSSDLLPGIDDDVRREAPARESRFLSLDGQEMVNASLSSVRDYVEVDKTAKKYLFVSGGLFSFFFKRYGITVRGVQAELLRCARLR